MGHRDELLKLLKIGPEDLEANRAGTLSPRQARDLVQSGRRNLFGGFVIALGLAAILFFIADKPLVPVQCLVAGALGAAGLAVGYVGYRRTRLAAADPRVETITGPARAHMRGRAGWYLTIGGRSFKLPIHYWHIHNDAPYRVYFAPKADRIISLEPDGWD